MKKIEYIIVILLLLLAFIWTNSLYTLWLFAAMAIIVCPVVIINKICAKKISIKFYTVNEFSDNTELVLTVENKSRFPMSHVKIDFACQNVVFASEFITSVSLAVGARKKEEYNFPIKSKYCGRINVEIKSIRVYDSFGLTSKKLANKGDCYFYQYPKEVEKELYEIAGSKVSDNDVNYKHVKGNDVSEILQIREYVKGDSVKQIHWKMSAKTGKMMVKELDTPNDNSVLLIFDYVNQENKTENQNIIEAVAAISKELIKNTTGHTLYRKNTLTNRIEHRGVFESSEYDIMLQELLNTEAAKSDYQVVDYAIEKGIINNYAKIIYVTSNDNKSNAAELEALEKCMVLYV